MSERWCWTGSRSAPWGEARRTRSSELPAEARSPTKRMSEISSTDVDIFRRLGNPEIVDVNAAGSTTRQIAAQMRQAIETAVAASRRGDADEEGEEEEEEAPRAANATRASESGGARPPSRLAQAMAAAGVVAAAAAPVSQEAIVAPALRVTQPRPAAVSTPEPPPRAPPAQASRVPAAQRTASDAGDSDDEDEELPPPPPSRARDPEEVRLEKQGLLIELQGLERKGVTLSRAFGMGDSVAELEFELQKQQSCVSTANAVAFMRDSLRMAFNGVEIANNRLGPFLSIDGWADSMTSDMRRFDNALERLYKRYWRKSQMSPLMELAWIIGGSLLAHHFKQKFFGPARPPSPAQPSPSVPAPSPQRSSSAAPPPPRSAPTLRRSSAGPPPATRPTLRPPSAVFG